ncbi:MAG: aldo/keto reductase [Gemmatimonadetes bacterium]|nr:aldo/keto reductase [Gemmatimonadota bacterium]
MKWKSFGRSGLKVTELCLGTMTLAGQADEKGSFAILDAAHEGGIRFMDTADCYPIPIEIETAGRTEELIGRWLKDRRVRDEWVIATKAYFAVGPLPIHRGNSRLHLRGSVEASLRRLGTDRIDLFLCHGWDPTVPVEETLRTLEDLRREGKILYAGLSNVRASEVAATLVEETRLALAGIAGLQPRYNLLYREAEESLFPVARRFGLGTMVYNPLAGGLLSGKHQPGAPPAEGTRFTLGDSGRVYRGRYWNEDFLAIAHDLKPQVAKHGLSLVTATIAWTIANPDVTAAIVGVSRKEQLADQLTATDTELPAELKRAMDAVWFDLPRKEPSLDTPRLWEFY